jgi:hypothetical protein
VPGWVRNYTFDGFSETVTFKAPYFCCKTVITETPTIDSGLFTNENQTECATNPTPQNSNYMKVSYFYCEFESRSGRGIQHYVIRFVSDLRQDGGFLRVLLFPPPIKLTATI